MDSKGNVEQKRPVNEQEIDLIELLYRILDRWIPIMLIAILGAGIAWAYTSYFVVPKYQSSSKIYVVRSSDSVVNVSDIQLGTYLANDYIQVFQTREVNEQVIMNLDLSYTYEEMLKLLSVSNPTNTRILEIKVSTTDPEISSMIANEYASVASDYIATVMQTDRPTVLSAAVPAKSPSSPNMIKNVVLGAISGAFLMIAIIVISVLTDNKIKGAEDLTKLAGLPVFAQIPSVDFGEEWNQIYRHKRTAKESRKKSTAADADGAESGGSRK